MHAASTRRLAAVVALAVLAAVVPWSSAAAQEPELRRIDLGATVTAGFGRGTGSGAWTLLEVEFSPQVPIAGRLEVGGLGASRGGAVRDVEVSAGATKVFHLLLPPADEVQASFVSSAGTRITLPRAGGGAGEDVVVGGIAAEPALPRPLNVAGLDRPVRGVRVDPAVIDLGPRALDALDALVVSATQLAALSDDQRDALAVAAATGLDLVVSLRPGDGTLPLPWTPIEGLTDAGDGGVALTPTEAAWSASPADLGVSGGGSQTWIAAVPAGRGRVIAVAGAPGEGGPGDQADVWSQIFHPRADLGMPLGSFDEGDLGNRLFGGVSTLPGMTGALLFLLVYLLLVGPVNALVVRRLGRRELTWVTVPAVTLVFTAIAALTATSGGPSSTPVTRAAWWLDGVGQEVTALSLQAPSRGTQQIVYPGQRDGMVGSFWTETLSFNAFDGQDTTFSTHLEALQTTTAIAYGPAAVAPPMDVAATFDDGVLEVTLANRTDATLEAVTVLAATAVAEVGTLAPGEERTITVDDLEAALPRAPGDRGMRMLGDRGRQVDGEVPGPGVAERLLAWNVLDRSPGTVWVTAATTDDLGLTSPRVRGQVDDRGSFVAVGVTPEHHGDTVLPHEVRRDLLRRGVWTPWRQHPLSVDGESEAVLRFRLPDPEAIGTLVSTLDEGGAVRPMDMGMADPWGNGCFEVTEIDADGNESEPEERCGDQVACPPNSRECGGDDTRVEACFEDGSCQVAERISDAEPGDDGPPESGFEIYDRVEARWVAADTVFDADDRADPARVVSPLGDVLVRARNVGFLPFGQRGLGAEGAA
ncbi:hypothetical protein [Egicoccus sp. AB-alg6-2]|uniref:hypothetical protein n=1 Tax=Egicoccus sp. AB-alg6-2 TaxID=3242692 RepID=UPI00359D8E0D